MSSDAKSASSLLKSYLNVKDEIDFRKTKSESDQLGFTHYTYQQYYNNVKIEFGVYKVHSKSGEIKTMNGDYFDIQLSNVSPILSKETAFESAIKSVGAEHYMWEFPDAAKEMDNYKKPEGELVILPADFNDLKEARLAYKFDIFATEPISRGEIYVDANNGAILFYNAIIKHVEHFGHIGESNHESNPFHLENAGNSIPDIQTLI